MSVTPGLAAAALLLSACAARPPVSDEPVELEIVAPDGEILAATWWPAEGFGPGLVLLGVAGPNDRYLSVGELAPFEALAEAYRYRFFSLEGRSSPRYGYPLATPGAFQNPRASRRAECS